MKLSLIHKRTHQLLIRQVTIIILSIFKIFRFLIGCFLGSPIPSTSSFNQNFSAPVSPSFKQFAQHCSSLTEQLHKLPQQVLPQHMEQHFQKQHQIRQIDLQNTQPEGLLSILKESHERSLEAEKLNDAESDTDYLVTQLVNMESDKLGVNRKKHKHKHHREHKHKDLNKEFKKGKYVNLARECITDSLS